MPERIVVTGVGAVTPIGNDAPSTWKAMVNGEGGVRRISLFDPTGFDCQIAAEVKGFDPAAMLGAKEARRSDRFLQFGVVAAHEALRDAGLKIDDSNATEIGVIVGSGIGGIATLQDQIDVMRSRGPQRVSPFLVPMMIIDMLAGQISISLGAKGPNYSIVSACATSGHCIGEAAELIRRGDARAVICGGTDAGITEIGVASFDAMRALSNRNDDPEHASRPFDAGRDGFVMGEGAGIMVLESLSHAMARDARIYGELLGYGASGDAHHITAPPDDGEGAQRAMRLALKKAGLEPASVDYINAHATSTPGGDRAETHAVKSVFGERAHEIPISSTKSMTGHLMGAGAAVEGIACLFAIRDGVVPPTTNLLQLDPACDLDYVPNVARSHPVRYALSNSFGFGGHNNSLIFGAFEA
ncbi:MAG: beta-ketoacyl-ACP synthase II [Chloroflexi bacterium]|nr:beta-ketoacyl-ACP synthase II [Chloroflexota bacterium]